MNKGVQCIGIFNNKNSRGNIQRGRYLKDKTGRGPIIFQKKNSSGQVWIETVIYLLIAFIMIGLVLSFIKPKIEELKDKAIIEQSVAIIQSIDSTILTMGSAGNKRLIEVGIKKGSFIIDSENDLITFEIDSRYKYSESGKHLMIGNINATTIETGRTNQVTLVRNFSEGYDLSYNGEETLKTLNKAPNPYKLFITNTGSSSNKISIDFNVE